MTVKSPSSLSTYATTTSRRDLVRWTAAAGLTAAMFPGLSPHPTLAADPLAARLDAVLAAAIDEGIPGAALHLEQGGKVLYSGAAGVSSLERKIPMRATDRFRIYSITKTFTATVVLQLVDEGILTLDDTVSRWLDDPVVAQIPNVDHVTLRQLLNHTSGIYDFCDDSDSPFWDDAFLGPGADWTKVWTVPQLLAYAGGDAHAPYFAPGEGVAYSNTGFLLLGLIVEAATGGSFGDELRKRILEPLALRDTFLAEGAQLPEGLVDGYELMDGVLVNVSVINLSWVWTAGGIVSTTADLARFARAVLDGELLSPESRTAMFTFTAGTQYDMQFGMGVIRFQTPNGTLVGMDGGSAGGNSTMQRLDPTDLTVVVLVNQDPDEGATDRIRDAAIKEVLGAD
jgi:D-alanyl-D-alanine carboxypeptidase